jgi:hypothetical protein
MLTTTKRTIATLTAAACLGGAGWAIADAGNSSGSGTASSSDPSTAAVTASPVAAAAQTATTPSTPGTQQGQPGGPPPGGGQRPDEKLLTGDDAAKAKAAALAKLPGSTVDRVETDADGGGVYEAHVTKSDGSRATVLFDKDFNVTSVLDR